MPLIKIFLGALEPMSVSLLVGVYRLVFWGGGGGRLVFW
jgi:hypothetical protein